MALSKEVDLVFDFLYLTLAVLSGTQKVGEGGKPVTGAQLVAYLVQLAMSV